MSIIVYKKSEIELGAHVQKMETPLREVRLENRLDFGEKIYAGVIKGLEIEDNLLEGYFWFKSYRLVEDEKELEKPEKGIIGMLLGAKYIVPHIEHDNKKYIEEICIAADARNSTVYKTKIKGHYGTNPIRKIKNRLLNDFDIIFSDDILKEIYGPLFEELNKFLNHYNSTERQK